MYNLGQILPHMRDVTSVASQQDKLQSGVYFLLGDIFEAETMVTYSATMPCFKNRFI